MTIVFFLAFSCTKGELLPKKLEYNAKINILTEFIRKNNIIVENDMLNFPTPQVMVKFLEIIETEGFQDKDLNAFEDAIKFTSFRNEYIAAKEDVENSSNEANFKSKLKLYQSIINAEDLSPKISVRNVLPVINKDGFIKMEGVIYKYNQEAVIVSHENTIEAVNQVEIGRSTNSNGFYEIPTSIIELRGSCSNSFNQEETEGDKRARIKYDAFKHPTFQQVTECGYETVWDPINQKWETKLQCHEVTKPKSILLGANFDGAAFRKILWTWQTYNTKIDLEVDMILISDGVTYHIEYDEQKPNSSSIVKSWTTAPDVEDVENPYGFQMPSANIYFKTRGVETAITHTCSN